MNEKYNLGKKIKQRRIELGLTQKALSADYMTRNMLSLIESGVATPSIDTLEYLCAKLELPIPYLFSESEDLSGYLRAERIEEIRTLLVKKNYKYCLELTSELGLDDEEAELILTICSFECGKQALKDGLLVSAIGYLNDALRHAKLTVYPVDNILATVPLYLACANNIQSPLLEFDTDKYEQMHMEAYDYEFYKYVSGDVNFSYSNPVFAGHMAAKKQLKRYEYLAAITLLTELEKYKNTDYNAYAFFSIYSDLEGAYKQIGDFENAYRYSTKRMSLLQAFNA